MSRIVRVVTPVRIHFGLLSFGQTEGPQYGGVGMMVAPPGVELQISPAEQFSVQGPMAERAKACVERLVDCWKHSCNVSHLARCAIQIQKVPPHHTGLGVGTQFDLAIAAGLNRFLERDDLSASNLAEAAGRGKRSAVGSYGFLGGGLIVDCGKLGDQPLGALAQRYTIPSHWRIVLIRAKAPAGLADEFERQAFEKLPPIPLETTAKLWSIVENQMLPALVASDCPTFGEAIYQYGRLAGNCFSVIQGGPYASPVVDRLVCSIRRYGVSGTGQSSWGPTVMAIVEHQQEAERLVERLRKEQAADIADMTVAVPNNTGAIIR